MSRYVFSQGEYWIRDLSGQQLLCINDNPISLQYLLRVNDLVRLSPQGPLLAYIGEGRFAEAAENSATEAGPPPSTNERERLAPEMSNDDAGGFWSRLRRRF
ncbi:hypothetical protein [Geobacter sp. OR-1]|uniref:hypothetical protein n=1 Tax=Geobacter sp. OR-1 TaxID=1266765 RepID=UPI0005AA2D10|nr:hypothetical protein [Geobacter sp. OR-1]